LLHFGREFDKDELAPMIEVIFPAFVNHREKVIFGRLFVGKNFVNLPHKPRGAVSSLFTVEGRGARVSIIDSAEEPLETAESPVEL
jgi:hypothetical protein